MRDEELVILVGEIGVYWPTFKVPQDAEDAELFFDIWAKMMRDVFYDDAQRAVEAMSKLGGEYAPAPGILLAKVKAMLPAKGGSYRPDDYEPTPEEKAIGMATLAAAREKLRGKGVPVGTKAGGTNVTAKD